MIQLTLVLWAFCLLSHGSMQDCRAQEPPDAPTPESTVIVANAIDAQFSHDFSALLRHLRLPWIVVDTATVPDPVRDKHLILLARPDAAYTGEIMRSMVTATEIEAIQAAAEGHTVLVKDSPWTEGRSVYICTGTDLLLARDAAEEAVREIMASAPPASAWVRTRFDAPLDDRVREYVDELRFDLDGAELPLADLLVDVGAKPRRRISAQQAAADVERLFYLLSHGYAGYGFFNQQGEFAQARARILDEISSRSRWTGGDLARLLYEQLSFITDSHMRIGDYQYARHLDFWYDTELELAPGLEGYVLTADGRRYTVLSINDQAPETFVFPSLNAEGEPIYRLGTLSEEEPAPLQLSLAGDEDARQLKIGLQSSDFAHYSEQVFREDNLGGIPVIRVRGFGDVHEEELGRFVATAREHRGEPVIIVDVRGNGGGNERWPIQWIQGLTGRRAEAVFISSELHSKTTMAGRANAFAHWSDLYPDIELFRQDAEWTASMAQAYEDGTRQAGWTDPRYPQMPLIPNDTTLIIAMNSLVASAGEGLVMRASQAENVVLVGENSMGALTFGNISTHQLPHSRLTVQLPINFGIYPDMEFREARGIAPDLWVPAADAVNYAVAAVRRGTITTYQPLPSTTLAQSFVPEGPWTRVRQEALSRWPAIAGIVAASCVWAYLLRKKPAIVGVVGIAWLITGGVWMLQQRHIAVGTGFVVAGVVCLVWGGIGLFRARHPLTERSA
jgi:hypothetical protein